MSNAAPAVARLVDVAARAGVSKATASKALAGRYDVGEETRRRVLAAAAELDFTPNALASGLGGKRTRSIGLVTSDFEARFFPGIMTGVEDALGEGRSSVILSAVREETDLEQQRIRDLLHRAVDGLILASPYVEARPPLQFHVPVPVVYVYGRSSSLSDTSVVADSVAGGALAASHLIQQGRRRIACITGPEGHEAAEDRLVGAREALHAKHLDLVPGGLLQGPWTEQWGWDAAAQLLDGDVRFDALLCGDDQIARGALDLLEMRGVRVPQQVAVIGYDNWKILSERSRRPFSTIDGDLGGIGRKAAELVSQSGGPERGLHRVQPYLIDRGTT